MKFYNLRYRKTDTLLNVPAWVTDFLRTPKQVSFCLDMDDQGPYVILRGD